MTAQRSLLPLGEQTCRSPNTGLYERISVLYAAAMTTTPENYAKHWRDIADQLTPWDIAGLARDEANGLDPDWLLSVAREFASWLVGAAVHGPAWLDEIP